MGGLCYCIQGWAGVDCGMKCEKYQDNGSCVDTCGSGKLHGPDRVCRSSIEAIP